MKHPIPDAALDDRLGFVGTAGSGKTYNASACVERLLDSGARIVVVDPLDVWWGLRLIADGSGPSGYAMPIFGGSHGDLPLSEHAGALIGETVAGMAESCIVSLGGLTTKAAERRFMLAFLDAIYRKASGEPVHIIFDEADLWAPQKSSEPMLQSRMEEICRRGRIKGLIPWLITQRPAVISKDVLSQVDGLVAFKLTSSQDRDALEGWIEGQADRQQWKEIRAALPTLQQGHGVVWVPGRGVLDTVAFPVKRTFDSSRTPKRGEKKRTAALKPLDLGKLKDRLAMVETETKANDPKALKAEIARLKALPTSNEAAKISAPDPAAIEAAEQRGFDRGVAAAKARGDFFVTIGRDVLSSLRIVADSARQAVDRHEAAVMNAPALPEFQSGSPCASPGARTPVARPAVPPARNPSPAASGDGSLSGPQRQLLQALAWWAKMGHQNPTRVQVAVIAGWRVTSGHLKNVAGSLRSLGLIEYPSDGAITLTVTGAAAAPAPDTSATLEDSVRAILTGPQRIVFDNLPKTGTAIAREEIANRCGWEPTSGHVKNVLGSMRSLEVIDYPSQGLVARAEWIS